MTTLIVGCGYLGLRVGRALAKRGERVFGTVRSVRRFDEFITAGVTPVRADVLDPASLERLPATDRVLYCVGFDRSSGIAMRTVYVEGLGNVLERLAGRTKRIVYASSTGVYGQDDGAWVDEESPTEPRHESGLVCLEAETVARAFALEKKIGLIVLRLPELYGPGRVPRLANIQSGDPIAGDPSKIVNLVHIDDAVAATVAALDHGLPGRVYHVVDDRPSTRLEFYGQMTKCLGCPPPRFVPVEAHSATARREESNKRIRNRRLHDELGVTLTYPDITTGIAAALDR